MTSEEVWGYIRMLELPYNSLHERGFISIGCEPCTRPVLPNQHEREGRWWWEESTQKECGLHAGNLITGLTLQAQATSPKKSGPHEDRFFLWLVARGL